MNKQKCINMHQYGPFIKKENVFYRICNNCKHKQLYPQTDEITQEYQNQLLVKYIIDIIIQGKINLIQSSDYFFKLISCLKDHISYIYINSQKKEKLLIKLQKLNIYFNSQIEERYNIINEFKNYLELTFKKQTKISEEELENQDKIFNIIEKKFNQELENILKNEENNMIEIESTEQNIKQQQELELLEETN